MFKPRYSNINFLLLYISFRILSVLSNGCGHTTTYLITAYPNAWHYFSTPNYPNPYQSGIDNCWLIRTVEPGNVIQLDTYSFELQSSLENCHYGDYVDVRDGSHDEAPVLGTLCGTAFRNITGSSGYMFVHFHTDDDTTTTYRGFMMRYRAVLPGAAPLTPAPTVPISVPDWASDSGCARIIYIEVTSIVETLISTGYPVQYPSGIDQCWQFHSAPDFNVQISIMQLETEFASDCSHADYLDVRNGPSLGDNRLALLCGQIEGMQLYGERYLLVRFKTNTNNNRHKGFKIAYWGEYGGETRFGITARIIIACIVVSLILAIVLTLKKKKGLFVRKRTVNVTANSRPPGPHVRGRPGQIDRRHSQRRQRQLEDGTYAAPQRPGYPQNSYINTNLLSYTPAAPPYNANVYPDPPEYTDVEDDPIYPAEFLGYPGGGFPMSPMSPPPPYKELPDDKPVANGAPAGANGSLPNGQEEQGPATETYNAQERY
jgi:hypothetical protein